MLARVCVFCGSSPGVRAAYAIAARALGGALARRGLGVVYGGAGVGVMGALADGALAAGGEVIGVLPRRLFRREVGHGGLTELIEVDSMHERKQRMAELASAFVALPGGYGTLEELFEVVTWAQLGIHRKPIGVLDVDGYFAPLATLLDHAVCEGFVRTEHRELVLLASSIDDLLDRLEQHRPPPVEKWLDDDEA